MSFELVTYHLEMLDPADLRPAAPPAVEMELRQVESPSPELSRFLYTAVGAGWYWVDRLSWTREAWLAVLDRPESETWVAYVGGAPAGYFELEVQRGDEVEIVYFGLLPDFIGKRLGGHLLNEAIRRAWKIGGKRVWVHTCNLDHPGALANYKKRGFRLFDEVTETVEHPPQAPGLWPASDGA